MGCPEITQAVARCPFLHAVSTFQGEEQAARLAVNPFAPSQDPRVGPILPEDPAGSVSAVFKLFHGRNGPIPLPDTRAEASPSPSRCPMSSHRGAVAVSPASLADVAPCPPPAMPMMASISLSGFGFLPDPGELFRRLKPRRPKQRQQKPAQQQPKPSSSAGASNPSSRANGAAKGPLSRFGPLGGLLPLATASGKLSCPPAIVAMRAAVAGLKPVRQLRPQALPIRSLAMAGTAIAANVPCGMWREHCRKLSPEWFVAVHATIPFVAMLRKAVLMPKWAILLTVAGALAGQQAGARLERARLRHLQEQQTSSRRCAAVGAQHSSQSALGSLFAMPQRLGVAS